MNDLSIADVQCHMAGVADQVTRLRLVQTGHSRTLRTIRLGGMRQADTEVRIYTHNEAGTVSTLCQAGTAIHIGIPHKLQRILRHSHTHLAAASHRIAGTAA